MKFEIDSLKSRILSILEEELPKDLFYHNRSHTLNVYEAASKYAHMEKISKNDEHLLLVASLLHDIGFTRRYDNNEELAVEIAQSLLPEYGFVKSEKKTIYGLIMATKIPQHPKTRLQKIICDSDFDYLGKPYFVLRADLLRSEWQIYRNKIYTDPEWYKLQLEFLEKHRYFTNSAKKLRGQGKIENIRDLRKRV